MQHRHKDRLEQVSPQVGALDQTAVDEFAAENADDALSLLADLANATDRVLRAKARRAAAQVFVRMAQQGVVSRSGIRRLERSTDPLTGDLDLDLTLSLTGGRRPQRSDEIITRQWASSERAICLLIDRSGSMSGKAVATAAMAAASVLVAAGGRSDCSVVAFAKEAIVLQPQGRNRAPSALIDDVLSLRGRGVTDLALALRAARRQLGRALARERVAVLLSDAKATTGADPITALRGLDRLHVLGTSDDPESVEQGRALARRGGGRYLTCASITELPRALTRLLE